MITHNMHLNAEFFNILVRILILRKEMRSFNIILKDIMGLIRMDDQFISNVWVKLMLPSSCKSQHSTATSNTMFRSLRGPLSISSQPAPFPQRSKLIRVQLLLMYKEWYVKILTNTKSIKQKP